MMVVGRVSSDDDIPRLVIEINEASWDNANEMDRYGAEALSAYLGSHDTVFVACHWVTGDHRMLIGIASARIEIKPYDGSRWLYVDEVDACTDHRRRGVGTQLMRKLIEAAEQEGCEEVWLGADVNNHAATALYRSLGPSEVAQVMGYTWELRQ